MKNLARVFSLDVENANLYRLQRLLLISPLISCMFIVPVAYSANWGAGIGAEVEHVRNPTQSIGDSGSNTASSVSLSLNGNQVNNWSQIDLNYNLSKYNHSRSTFRDQTVVNGSALLLLDIVPRRFSWIVTHSQQEISEDSLLPDTPENRTERQVFSTGPNLAFKLSDRDFASVSFRKEVVKFESEDENESTRESLSFSLTHLINSTSSVSLNGSSAEVDFENSVLEYRLDSLYLGYSKIIKNGELTLEVGENRAKSEADVSIATTAVNAIQLSNDSETSGTFINLLLSQTFFSNHALQLQSSRNITDSSFSDSISSNDPRLVSGTDATSFALLSNLTVNEVVEVRRHELGYRYNGEFGRLGFGASVFRDENLYESGQLDQHRVGYSIFLPYRIDENMRFQTLYTRAKIERDNQSAEVTTSSLGLNLFWQSSLKLSWRAGYNMYRRDTEPASRVRSESLGLGFEYQF